MRRASTPRADSLLLGMFRYCSVSFLLGFHLGVFKCEFFFKKMLLVCGGYSLRQVRLRLVQRKMRCSGTEVQWEMRASLLGDTERSCIVGFTVVAGDFLKKGSQWKVKPNLT